MVYFLAKVSDVTTRGMTKYDQVTANEYVRVNHLSRYHDEELIEDNPVGFTILAGKFARSRDFTQQKGIAKPELNAC